ncbi:MAG: FeoA domain-containing protein [Candidatus Omnitrophica bacterium]|jgi:Fe2+ transport system protein FeoA|nr:FeoA domain-containing protein [Candidatus Omnitrophota bacterium]MDD5661158.1 FeoA domain-containing protein [Candidatus Omnitrophota bacterium]
MKKISLLQAGENEKIKILEILGGSNLERRLMSMGVYKGKEVVKLSHIGLRGPVVIKSGRSILALGHGVAAKIIVER